MLIFSLRTVPRYPTLRRNVSKYSDIHVFTPQYVNKRLYQISVPNITQPSGHRSSAIYLKVIGRNLTDYHLQIHDRDGKLVHESNDIKSCWNGKDNDMEVAEGMYYYFVRAKGKTTDGYENVERSGTFVVVK